MSRPQPHNSDQSERYEGIEFLRALMSLLVVAWHLQAVPRGALFDPKQFDPLSFTPGLYDLLIFNILLLAVPGFYLITCFLSARGTGFGRKEVVALARSVTLLICWAGAYHLFWGGMPQLTKKLFDWESYIGFYSLIFSGLNTIFYFFATQALLQLVVFLTRSLRTNMLLLLLASACGIVVWSQYMTVTANLPLAANYWSPLNFLPFPFAGVLMYRYRKEIKENAVYVIVATACTALIFATVEWLTLVHVNFFGRGGYAFPAYTRLSLGFTMVVLLTAAISHPWRLPRWLAFMATHSLALYCLHMFTLIAATSLFGFNHFGLPTLAKLPVIVAVVMASYLIAYFGGYVINRRLLFATSQ